MLLLLTGAMACVIAALLLVTIQKRFADDDLVAPPDQAPTIEPDTSTVVSPPSPSVELDLWLQAIALPALEGEGRLPIYFRLSAPAEWPVDITYETSDDTAEAGTDFVSQSGVITIPPGQRTVEVTIPLIEDGLAESVEMFRVTLSVDPSQATLTDTELMATVLDDDENDNSNDSPSLE